MRLRLSISMLVLAVLVGIMTGVGLFTFTYAEGFSYVSNDPKVCANCHIMRDEYDSWRKGPHHAAAVCNDCHVPVDLIGKYTAKGLNGYHHSTAFTFGGFHEPVMIKERNAGILQENCLRCHGDFVHDIVAGAKTDADAVQCVHCHRGVGHGARN